MRHLGKQRPNQEIWGLISDMGLINRSYRYTFGRTSSASTWKVNKMP